MDATADDVELMRRSKEGDSEAFAVIVQRHKGWLQRLFYHLFWDWEEAQDATQEVLVRVWLARERYEPRARFRTYLFAVARNYWLNRQARSNCRPRALSLQEQFSPETLSLLEKMAGDSPSPEDAVIRSYERFRIRRAVSGLPEKQRLVFILSHFEDLRYAEIAELLDIPVGTVKSRMSHAVQALRDELTEEEGSVLR